MYFSQASLKPPLVLAVVILNAVCLCHIKDAVLYSDTEGFVLSFVMHVSECKKVE